MPPGSAAVWTRGRTDEFVGMYVNDWTRDFGARGGVTRCSCFSIAATRRASCPTR